MNANWRILGAGVALAWVATTGRAEIEQEPSPTWARDVAPLLYRHCVECHRPGQAAPFSLLDYGDAARRARFLARVTRDRLMPPWLPSEGSPPLQGERWLSEAEIAVLEHWARAGAPAGALEEAPPPPPEPAGGWRLGPPDIVVAMPEPFTVPAGGPDVYRVFVLPWDPEQIDPAVRAAATIPDSDWLAVRAIEVRPGARRVVHHALVYADSSGEARRRAAAEPGPGYESFGGPGFSPSGFLGGYVPGTIPAPLPDGIAERFPLRADLAMQVHYAPTGREEVDRTEVGIYLTREPVKRVLEWVRLGSFDLEIPAGAAEYRRRDSFTFPVDVFVLSVSPHMHYLGKSFAADAVFPDGSRRPLLRIDRWRFQWQDKYRFARPWHLPRGTRIEAEWVFDNSEANPANPHRPPRHVRFGPNTSDEMCEFHLDVIPVRLDDYEPLIDAAAAHFQSQIDALTPAQRRDFGFDVWQRARGR